MNQMTRGQKRHKAAELRDDAFERYMGWAKFAPNSPGTKLLKKALKRKLGLATLR